MKKLAPLALAAALALGLSACSDGGTIDKGAAESSTATESTAAAAANASSESSDETAQLQFGDKYTWENGLAITLSKPSDFKPSEWASADDSENFVTFEVTVENGTGEPFDPSLMSFSASSGGLESEQVFDSENKLDGGPTTTIQNDKSIKFLVGFGVADKNDITMDVSPDVFNLDSKTFVS